MKTVNSLSGGRTSSYIAANYPADIDVFALVCIDDHNANAGKIDKATRQIVNDKLQKYCSDQPEFLATAEDPVTIKTMLDLEQHIGREIVWVRGPGFYDIIKQKDLVPNKRHRFCTTLLKIEPIFRFLYMYHELPVKMRIGFRYDESDRAEGFRESFKFSQSCQYQEKSNRWINRWVDQPFRVGEFPLIDDQIVKLDVNKYWNSYNIRFPEDSNCQFCFHKHPQQLRQNFENNPSIMFSGAIIEEMNDHTLHSDFSLLNIRKIHIQQDLFGMKGSGCHGGFCTS